jgi:hypothetical protein
MTTQTEIQRPAATLPEAAPVAMQRGRHNDRIVLARLRVERRWLGRDRDKAGLAPDPQPRWAMSRGLPLDDLSRTEQFFASPPSRARLSASRFERARARRRTLEIAGASHAAVSQPRRGRRADPRSARLPAAPTPTTLSNQPRS